MFCFCFCCCFCFLFFVFFRFFLLRHCGKLCEKKLTAVQYFCKKNHLMRCLTVFRIRLCTIFDLVKVKITFRQLKSSRVQSEASGIKWVKIGVSKISKRCMVEVIFNKVANSTTSFFLNIFRNYQVTYFFIRTPLRRYFWQFFYVPLCVAKMSMRVFKGTLMQILNNADLPKSSSLY